MQVRELMTPDVQYCSPDTNLAAAAKMMWDSDCGALPIVTAEGRVQGVITDRDICMAAATKDRAPSAITVWETSSGKAIICHPNDNIHQALELMARGRVRRLPVVDEDGTLRGMVAMNDLILAAGEHRGRSAAELSTEDVIHTLKTISAHRVLVGI